MKLKKQYLSLTAVVLAGLALAGCGGRNMLFNGRDLEGWKLYLEDPDVDVLQVWTVKDGVLRCQGTPNGYMRTTKKYSDYKLHVEWRWPAEPTNSGVLMLASGPEKIWIRSIEAQLAAGSAGDIILIGQGVALTVDGKRLQDESAQYIAIDKKNPSSEKPPGEWNSYDIICTRDLIKLYVNGVLQNQGTNPSESAGWICLQSEGSPIEFRNVYIEPLD